MVHLPVELRATRGASVFLVAFQAAASLVVVQFARALLKRLIPVPAVVDGITLLLGLLAVVALVIGARHAFSMRLRMDEQGLTLHTLRGYVSVRFDELRELYPVMMQDFVLVTADGRRLKASTPNNLEIEDVWRALVARIRPRLLAEYEARLAAGESLQVGAVRLDRDGIERKQRRVSWAEIAHVEEDEPLLYFFREGEQRAALKLDAKTPNGFLLPELWRRLSASRGSAPRAAVKAPARALGPADPELGALIEERNPSQVRRWLAAVAGAAVILASLAPMVGASRSGPRLLPALLGVGGLVYAWRTRGRGFRLYEHGVRTPWGALRFDALEHVSRSLSILSVQNTAYHSLAYELSAAGRTLLLKDAVALRDDERPLAAWEELERRLAEPLVRKKREELRRGGSWVLGDLVIKATRLGSQDEPRMLSLEDVEHVKVLQDEYIAVWRKGGPEDEPDFFHTGRMDAVLVPPLIEALRGGTQDAPEGSQAAGR